MSLFTEASNFINKYTNPMLYGYTQLGNYANKKISNWVSGGSQTSPAPTQVPQIKQVETFNERYPGFNEEDYNRLVQIVDGTGKTGNERAQLMDELYQYYYPQVLNHHKLEERQQTINNWVYENGEKLANGDKSTNARYRAANLSQLAKQKFDIAYNVKDVDVIKALISEVPNGEELLTKFLDTGDTELLYATGIYEQGEEAPDFRSQKDIANEVLGGNWWKNTRNNMYANSFSPLDSWEKALYRLTKNAENLNLSAWEFNTGLIPKSYLEKKVGREISDEEYNNWVNSTKEKLRQQKEINKGEIMEYNNLVDKANQSNRAKTVNPIVDNYYNRRNFTELLAEGDIDGFFYKGLGDAASNWDMPIIIGASIVNPAMGTALMGTNSYVRESEEAYETMRNAGATHEQAEAGGAIVGLVNTAIEVYLDKLLGGTETTTSTNVRNAIKNNVMKEVMNKPFDEILNSGIKTYVGSSLEEGLEEWLQNIVTNAGEMTVKENPEWKDLFKGGRAAAEGGIFNPFNLLAPGTDVYKNVQNNEIIKNQTKDLINNVTPDGELLTRTIPEKVVEGGMKLTPTERARVEQTGITPANFILNEGLAGLDDQDKIIQLANIGAEGYNNVTNTFKEVIPDTEKIESEEAQKMLNIMAKVIENSDILSEEYADYLKTIKNLAKQTKFDPYTALAIKRDFDALAGHDLYNSKGQVMKNVEKETIAGWRADLNEKLNELGDKYGVDVRKENQRVMNSITIRDGLLRAMSQNKKNNFLGLGDLGFGALLSSGNPIQAVAMIGLKKFAQNNIGNLAQYLYNLNNSPLTPKEKKGASFIKKGNNNAGNLSLGSIMNNPSTVDNSSEIDVSNLEVGINPMDTIKDKNVGLNPMDVVETTDTSNQVTEAPENWAVEWDKEYNAETGRGNEYYSDTDSISETEQNSIKNKFKVEYPDKAEQFDGYAIDNGLKLKIGLENTIGRAEGQQFLKNYFENPTVNNGNTVVEETTITEKPTEVKSIDEEGNWSTNNEGGIKIKYHPDGYLDVRLSEYPSQDEMIGFEEFEYEPVKEINLTILDKQTGKPVRSNTLNSIQELMNYLEDYFVNGNTNI